MGAAAYNRGSRLISMEADEVMPAASARAERQAAKDEAARLRAQVAWLEGDLARARRCIAELRRSKDARLAEASADRSSSQAAIKILTRIAFPGEAPPASGSVCTAHYCYWPQCAPLGCDRPTNIAKEVP